MNVASRILVLATLAVLAGCSARTSGAQTPQEPKPASEKAPEPEKAEKKDGLSSVETTDERREGLEEKLDSSLREFDGLILKEQEILEERREAEAASGGGGGGGAAGGSESSETGEEGSGAAGAEQNAGNVGGTGGSPDAPSGEDGAPVASETGDTGELSNGRIPPDVGDGRDDDIVARQLREAAMNEQDPALREKLWDEYRAYKFGTKKPPPKPEKKTP